MHKFHDALIGFALADAMGVPVEFHSRGELKSHPITTMIGEGTYQMPKGCWSDDTSLTIATMDAIINNDGKLNSQVYKKIMNNFYQYTLGAFTPTGFMFDIGYTTKYAIKKFSYYNVDPLLCGGNEASHNAGNGALMRMLPLAFYVASRNLDDTEIYFLTKNISSLTHRLETCILGSYIYVQYFKYLYIGYNKYDAYSKMQHCDYSFFTQDTKKEYYRILEKNIDEYPENEISSMGKTRPTLEACLWSFMNSQNYDEAILKAINLGEDTDTIGACTGGLAGFYYGEDTINKQWLKNLKKISYLHEISEIFENSIV